MSPTVTPRGLRTLALIGTSAFGALAAPASADAAPSWNCRASAAYVDAAGQDRVEPLVANGSSRTAGSSPDRAFCAADDAGAPTLTVAGLRAQAPFAQTRLEPAGALPVDQRPTARAGVEDASLAAGPLAVRATAVQASAEASCVGGAPRLGGTSRVTGLDVNGTAVSVDQPVTELTGLTNVPLGGVVRIRLNGQSQSGATLTQRAVEVELLAAPGGTPLARVVLGEASVTAGAGVCDRSLQGGGGSGTGSGGAGVGDGGGDGSSTAVRFPCTPGSAYDATRERCVIVLAPASAAGPAEVIVVGRTYEGPVGGRVVALARLPKALRASVCANGRGPRYAVLGTKRRDRITGTQRGDRIFALAGNDHVSSGGGNDCVAGGAGRDVLSGGLGADRLGGGTGNDAVNGGSGTDRLDGGRGNDSINTGYGRDAVIAGSGRDVINASTAGPASARIACGSGRDKLRINRNEKRRHRACETVYSIR